MGLIVGIAALLLTFPISLLANLASPYVKEWWATRSRAALLRRQRDLKKLKDVPPDERMDWILYSLSCILIVAATGVQFILIAIIWMIVDLVSEDKARAPMLFFIGFLAFSTLIQDVYQSRIQEYRRRVSPAWRAHFEKELERISAKLAEWENPRKVS